MALAVGRGTGGGVEVLFGLNGGVGCGEGQIEEEGFGPGLAQPGERGAGNDVGHIAGAPGLCAVFEHLDVARAFALFFVGEVVGVAAEDTEGIVEAVGVGRVLGGVAEVPLAGERRVIAEGFQLAGESGFGGGQSEFAALLEPGGFVVTADVVDADGALESAHALGIASGGRNGWGNIPGRSSRTG